MKILKENKTLITALIIFSFLFIFPPISFYEQIDYRGEYKKNPFEKIKLQAKSAYVFDILKNKVIFDFNSQDQLPLASLTKIMTAIVINEQMPADTIITISEKDIKAEGDDGLFVGEKWLLSDLTDFILIKSSNDATMAVSSAIKSTGDDFLFLMNKKAKDIGLMQTYFLNETGLDISSNISGAYSSTLDTAKLMIYAFTNHQKILEATSRSDISLYSVNYGEHKITNTNKYVKIMPQMIASKTGFTDLAGGNLAIIFDIGFNHPVVAVVMGSTAEDRFIDMQKLIDATFEWFK